MKILVLGGGVIGSSWAALMLAHGHKVAVHDPDEQTCAHIAQHINAVWPQLVELGLADGAAPLDMITASTDLAKMVDGCQWVQENGPDRIAIKHDILRALEPYIDSDVTIASSTTALLCSDIQAGAKYPERVIVAHPINPPHLIPLVELAAGQQTNPIHIERAREFYTSMHREVIEVRREAIGHIANRLNAALYREVVHMVAEGIATVEDVDRAIRHGAGLRWAFYGPNMIYHMGGGVGGYEHYLRHLGPSQVSRWADLGQPQLSNDVAHALIAGVTQMLDGKSFDTLTQERDEALVALLKLKHKMNIS